MTRDERNLKGFNWSPDRRPADRNAVTSLTLRASQRNKYAARPRARFRQTDIYFPGYISDINRQIAVRDSLRKVREAERKQAEALAGHKASLDSLSQKDTLRGVDSLMRMDSLALADSLKLAVAADSLAVGDSLKRAVDSVAVSDSLINKALSPAEMKAALKAEKLRKKEAARTAREAARKKRQEDKEKRWGELDKRDAAKATAKEAKRKAKERERKRKALEAAAKEIEKDARALEAYIEKYRKEKENKK